MSEPDDDWEERGAAAAMQAEIERLRSEKKMRLQPGQLITERIEELEAEIERLRAEKADLRAALEYAQKGMKHLQAEKAELLAALSKARTVIGSYWPLVGPESEPEKSTIEALNMIDAAIARAEGKYE